MLVDFFYKLREAQIPVSITEYLTLMSALEHRVSMLNVDDFYYLARCSLVKDERHFDRFDQVFGVYFQGMEELFNAVFGEVPEEWLKKQAELMLSEEEKKQIEAMGGWEKLMEELRKRLEEQKGQHHGGNKWIGTGGKSPYGAHGYNPEGVRIGQEEGRNRRAVKVWEKREFRNFDDSVELGTRNIKVALRKLRHFAREGAEDELDLDDTIRSTARNAGLLDIKMMAERRNATKVLLFLDVGGSMDDHVKVCEELFSATRTEFKHLEYYYFHNFVYESVWKDNRRRHTERIPTLDVIHKYGRDHKLIFVGDASMSPYEIAYPGGSVEHWNEEAGQAWLDRLLTAFPYSIWLNPKAENVWQYTQSIQMTQELMGERMFPLTIEGLESGIKELKRKLH
ncbi:MAG: VWA domain-containing protein [Pseudomonadota bacterium]